jgi:thioredoxin-like negative regulator of GroEL
MDKKVLYIVGCIVLVIMAAATYLLMNSNKNLPVETRVTTDQTLPQAAEQVPESARPGAYIDYKQGVIQSTPGTKLLFFHAPWCPQCRQLEADIKKGDIPDNVTIIKVDYDSQQALRMQYGVTIQTTIVKVNDDGSLAKKYVAYEEPTLHAVIKNLLP